MQLAKDHERVALRKATARSGERRRGRGAMGGLELRPDQHPENSIGKIKLCRGFMP
jgi:hypothetical protein